MRGPHTQQQEGDLKNVGDPPENTYFRGPVLRGPLVNYSVQHFGHQVRRYKVLFICPLQIFRYRHDKIKIKGYTLD
jgi:hypothetical protein